MICLLCRRRGSARRRPRWMPVSQVRASSLRHGLIWSTPAAYSGAATLGFRRINKPGIRPPWISSVKTQATAKKNMANRTNPHNAVGDGRFRPRSRHLANSTKHTRRPRFCLFAPLCENMTSSTISEVHNVSHCHKSWTEKWPWAILLIIYETIQNKQHWYG